MAHYETTGVGDECLGVLNTQEIAARRIMERDLDAFERRQDEADRILARVTANAAASVERAAVLAAIGKGEAPKPLGEA